MAQKIGVFGGTFNPIHNAHLMIAQHALSECALSEIVFLPNGNPPHKKSQSIIAANHRLEMVRLAIEGYEHFSVCDYEINRTEPSYTVDTNRALKKIFNAALYFIIGADSLYSLSQWKNPDILLKECRFIVADRNCQNEKNLKLECERLNSIGGDFTYLSMPTCDISSTEIRNNIYNGKDCSRYIPDNVLSYIMKNELYKS